MSAKFLFQDSRTAQNVGRYEHVRVVRLCCWLRGARYDHQVVKGRKALKTCSR